MNRGDIFVFWCILSSCILPGVKCCERDLQVRGAEDYCWTKNVEMLDRLQHTGKSFLNFAKKTIGMDVEESDEPQKCEYYNCIFRELKMLDENEYPCRDKMTKWMKSHVIYNHAIILLSQIDKCSDRLSNSTISGTYFLGDQLDDAILAGANKTSGTQSKCDIIAEYMKCMSLVEQEETCPVFQYP